MEVINPNFFSSLETGRTIPSGYKIQMNLPKMLDSNFAQHKEIAQQSVELSIQIVIITEIAITLVIAASLKSMWNLLNVAQVLAYMRFYVNWPAFMNEIFMWIDNAITMKPVTD